MPAFVPTCGNEIYFTVVVHKHSYFWFNEQRKKKPDHIAEALAKGLFSSYDAHHKDMQRNSTNVKGFLNVSIDRHRTVLSRMSDVTPSLCSR